MLTAATLWLLQGSAVQVAPLPEYADAIEPQLAVGRGGKIYVAFGLGTSIFTAASADGRTFSTPKLVAECNSLDLGMRRGPRIVATEQAIVVSAIGTPKGASGRGDLYSWRSSDFGKTWSTPVRVNDVRRSAREGLHAMAASKTGEIACGWLDLRSNGTKLYVSRSSDIGLSWSVNEPAYESPSGSICECCNPSLAYDGVALKAMFRNSLDGNRDIYLTSVGSSSKGTECLDAKHWPLAACPMDGGSLTVDSSGGIACVWRNADDIYRNLRGSTSRVGSGSQPAIAVAGRRCWTFWIRDGKLISLTEAGEVVIAPEAADPVAISVGGRCLVAWGTPGAGVRAAWID